MIVFKSDDEKHAWDIYVAGAMAYLSSSDTSSENAAKRADTALELRRNRERPIPAFGPRPRPGSGKDGQP